jgi:hypothetical protein
MDINGYVTLISDRINLNLTNPDEHKILADTGFTPTKSKEFTITINSEQHKISIMRFLQDNNFSFSAEPGWSPSELFEHYRKQNLLSGPYKRISWIGPNNTKIVIV